MFPLMEPIQTETIDSAQVEKTQDIEVAEAKAEGRKDRRALVKCVIAVLLGGATYALLGQVAKETHWLSLYPWCFVWCFLLLRKELKSHSKSEHYSLLAMPFMGAFVILIPILALTAVGLVVAGVLWLLGII